MKSPNLQNPSESRQTPWPTPGGTQPPEQHPAVSFSGAWCLFVSLYYLKVTASFLFVNSASLSNFSGACLLNPYEHKSLQSVVSQNLLSRTHFRYSVLSPHRAHVNFFTASHENMLASSSVRPLGSSPDSDLTNCTAQNIFTQVENGRSLRVSDDIWMMNIMTERLNKHGPVGGARGTGRSAECRIITKILPEKLYAHGKVLRV